MLDAPDAGRGNDPDSVAKVIRALGIPFVALNPGASFRGLHDSLVNNLGNHDPRMLHCLHGTRGGHRAWLGQGHQPPDGGGAAQQRWADAWRDGDL